MIVENSKNAENWTFSCKIGADTAEHRLNLARMFDTFRPTDFQSWQHLWWFRSASAGGAREVKHITLLQGQLFPRGGGVRPQRSRLISDGAYGQSWRTEMSTRDSRKCERQQEGRHSHSSFNFKRSESLIFHETFTQAGNRICWPSTRLGSNRQKKESSTRFFPTLVFGRINADCCD